MADRRRKPAVADPYHPHGPVGYHCSDRTFVVGNTGLLEVGFSYSAYKGKLVQNVRVEAHNNGAGTACGRGGVTCIDQTGTTFSATASVNVPKAFKLTPGQVGRNAPTAPRI
jgi:hypothetical protein